MDDKLIIPTVFLLPIPIAEDALDTLSPAIAGHLIHISHFFVEDVRTARRAIKRIAPAVQIETLQLSVIDKHTGPDITLFRTLLKGGTDIGIMSESGCPAIADPGAELVSIAQEMGIRVLPLVGPNSIILSLMASGLNGQSFAFNGYLPVKEPDRGKRIKELEQRSQKERQTQIFIETPYRNTHLLNDLIKHCSATTMLCIAQDVTGKDEYIRTRTINDWKRTPQIKDKVPTVFLILAK